MGINKKPVGIYACSKINNLKQANIIKLAIEEKYYYALVDSGAAVSLVKPNIAEGFEIEINNNSILDIQGNTIPTLGSVTLPLTVIDGSIIYHNFIVVSKDSFRTDLLLGIDFLSTYSIKIDWGNSCMYAFGQEIPLEEENIDERKEVLGTLPENKVKIIFQGVREKMENTKGLLNTLEVKTKSCYANNSSLVPLTQDTGIQTDGTLLDSAKKLHLEESANSTLSRPKETAVSNEEVLSKSYEDRNIYGLGTSRRTPYNSRSVFCGENVRIPAMCQAVCMANLKKVSKIETEHVVLEADEDLPSGILVAKVLCKTNGQVPVRINNITNNEIILPAKMKIAQAFEVEIEAPSNEKNTRYIMAINKTDSEEVLTELNLNQPVNENEIRLKNLILESIDIFMSPNQKLTCTTQISHKIITEDVPPICKRPYRVPYHRQEILKKEIQKLLDDDIIEESQSPWSFPAILLEKKRHPGEEVQHRLVIDYRGLNNITKTDYFPLPNIQETIDKLSGATYFSTMDLASGYFQVQLHTADQEKTAFSTPDNHYQFKRMAMGLKNAPATWSRLMYHILGKLTYEECLVYLDDIIVFSVDVDTRLERLRHAFQKMKERNLKFKPKKCHFLKTEIEYLGHIIKKGGYTTHPDKTKVIKSYPVPTNVKGIRAFLGLCGFYRKFVPNFAQISQPLTLLTKKNVKYHWSEEQEKAFESLKEALITPPILRYPDFKREFIVNTDASGTAIASILTQKYDGVEHPIIYSSRTLNSAEQRYSTIEREMLAIVDAVKRYRVYLTGTHFTIVTDHRPLRFLLTIKDPSSRLAKWAMYLMEYTFTITYRPGKMNANVDGLTRLQTDNIPINAAETKNSLNLPIVATISEEDILPAVSVIWSKEELKRLQEEDAEINKIKSSITLENNSVYYLSEEQLLYRRRESYQRNDQLLAPATIILKILQLYHNSIYSAHPGQKKTQEIILRDFYWPAIRKDVKNFVEKCHSCNMRKTNPQPPVEMQKSPVPSLVWGRISLDLVGPLNRTQNNNKYILTCVDFLTRYPVCIPIADIKAETVAKAFVEKIITQYGIPREILTDCGTQFIGKLFKEICKLLEITKLQTTPYHPAANGIIERMHKTLKTMISHFVSDYNDSWDEILPYCLMAYRNIPHEATKESPFFLMFGRDMELPIHLTIKENRVKYNLDDNYVTELLTKMQMAHVTAKENIEKSINKRCEKFNHRKTRREFMLGDVVYMYSPAVQGNILSRKLQTKWRGPYRIIEKKGPVTFKIKEIHGKKEHMVHADRLKLYKGNLGEEEENLAEMNTQEAVLETQESIEENQNKIDDFLNHGQELNENQTILNQSDSEESDGENHSDNETSSSDDTLRPDEESDSDPEEDSNKEEGTRRSRTREIRMPSRFKDFIIE